MWPCLAGGCLPCVSGWDQVEVTGTHEKIKKYFLIEYLKEFLHILTDKQNGMNNEFVLSFCYKNNYNYYLTQQGSLFSQKENFSTQQRAKVLYIAVI